MAAVLSEFQELKEIMEKDEFPSVLQSEENKRRENLNREAIIPENLTRAKEHLMQSANLLNLIIACVDKAVAPKVPQIVQTSEFFSLCVQVLFNEAKHLVDHMPMRPLK